MSKLIQTPPLILPWSWYTVGLVFGAHGLIRYRNSKYVLRQATSITLYISNAEILIQHDYHLVIPDLRGFGSSTHPGEVKGSGTMYDLVGDLKCILDDVKTTSESVICVGFVFIFFQVQCSSTYTSFRFEDTIGAQGYVMKLHDLDPIYSRES